MSEGAEFHAVDGAGAAMPTISEPTIQQLIEGQAREQSLRGQELDIRRQELEHQSKHASAILDAQVQDRQSIRSYAAKKERTRLIFIIIVIVVLVMFAGWALAHDKDDVVMDIIKVLLGFAGGYATGFGRAKSSQKEEPVAE